MSSAQPPPPPAAHDLLVRARGTLWRVSSIVEGDGCRALRLVAAGSLGAGTAKTLIEPFDRVRRLPAGLAMRTVSRRRWVRRLRELLLDGVVADLPSTFAGTRLELLPYQLEPVLSLLRGESARFLLADHVGLGKTIQAGVLIRELTARGEAERVLIVTPAGLREQWRRELATKVGVHAEICDAAWLIAQSTALPLDVSPWSVPGVRLVSMDLLKRPEVLNGLEGVLWDLVVVDEAHLAASGTDRRAAVDAVARRSRRVVLVTATPHDGSDARFEALCAIGRLGSDDRLVVFRRTPAVLGLQGARRTRVIRVGSSPAEQRMRSLLTQYARAVCAWSVQRGSTDARLALSVLVKRSFSSPRALYLTAWRRRTLLQAQDHPAATQTALPFEQPDSCGDDGELRAEWLGVPGLRETRHELAWLGAIAHAARRAAADDRKLRALEHLLRRTAEPVIVFTEFRDTLAGLVRALCTDRTLAVIHGAQAPGERRRALDEFSRGAARILLATDAASEGLNLHERCRAVVSLELPWNPNRLEQRIGRVDRIGQTRPVHALHLVGADTREEALWDRIQARRRAIAASLDDTSRGDPVWDLDDALREPARCRTDRGPRREPPPGLPGRSPGHTASTPAGDRSRGHAFASSGIAYLDMLRRLGSNGQAAGAVLPGRPGRKHEGAPRLRDERPCFARFTLRGAAGWHGTTFVAVYRLTLFDECRGPAELTLVPVTASLSNHLGDPAAMASLLAADGGALHVAVLRALEARFGDVASTSARRQRLDLERLDAIELDRRSRLTSGLVQPGLFAFGPAVTRHEVGEPRSSGTGGGSASPLLVSARLALAAVVRSR